MDHPPAASPRIVFMGSGPFALPALTMLAESYDVIAVVTQPDRQVGRGRRTQRGSVAALADEQGIPVQQPHTFKDDAAVQMMADLEPDLLVVASYGRILPRRVLAIPCRGTLNLHPSALPRHRGPSPIAGAILAGDTVTAVTVIEMVLKMDAGPIIAKRDACIEPEDTTESLTGRLATQNARLLIESLPQWLAGMVQPVAQNEEDATYTPILTKDMGRLNWAKPAEDLAREVRAFVPWPVSHSPWAGGTLRVFATDVESCPTEGVTGQVLSLEPNGIIVQTGDGCLVLREVQAEGGRRMPASEFTRGHPHIRQAILG